MSERDDYPGLAALADAHAASGRSWTPEAIRCYLEVGALRSRLATLTGEYEALRDRRDEVMRLLGQAVKERRGGRVMPERIQLRRTKGWRLPENTVVVSRPSLLGNPFHVVKTDGHLEPWEVRYVPNPKVDTRGGEWFVSEWATKAEAIADAVEAYRDWATEGRNHYWRVQCFIDDWRLAGKNLACWCPLELADGLRAPCHADVLLGLANPEVVFPWSR